MRQPVFGVLGLVLIMTSCSPPQAAVVGGVDPAPTAPVPSTAPPGGNASPGAIPAPTGSLPSPPPVEQPVIPWKRLPSLPVGETLTKASVWAATVDDVYVAAGGPEIWHLQAGRWERMAVAGASSLDYVGGIGGEVYATGDAGALYRLSGGQWVAAGKVAPSNDPVSAVAKLLEIGAKETAPVSLKLGDYWVGMAGDHLFAAGPGGLVWAKHKDTGTWIKARGFEAETYTSMACYTGGKSPASAFVVGKNGSTLRVGPSTFEPFGTRLAGYPHLNAVATGGASGIFAAADGGQVLYFGDESWRPIVQETKLGNVLGIFALAARETVIVTSDGSVYAGPYGLLR